MTATNLVGVVLALLEITLRVLSVFVQSLDFIGNISFAASPNYYFGALTLKVVEVMLEV